MIDKTIPVPMGCQPAPTGRQPAPMDTAAVEPAPTETTPEARSGGFFREMMETLLLAVVLFVAVRAVVQNTRVEGHSMEPTLHDGQHVMVNKLVYDLTEPKRGDIVVLRSPEGGPKPLIKRVIGLPGEQVRLVEGQVYVGDERLDESYLPASHGNETWGPYTLQPDEYLVLGDNRDNSNDSRRFGPIQRTAIIGKAWFSLWPLEYGLTIGHQVAATSGQPVR
ncbi:MAG: signal peptidase I [Anaerolineae bacterium]